VGPVSADHPDIEFFVDALLSGRVQLDDGDILTLLGEGLARW
jgi:hypothetical protein